MASYLGKCFVDVESLPDDGFGMVQLAFIAVVYAFVLFNASGWIKDGSELLLLVPSLSGIIGSIVLPVLGAVPDGAIVLFSGMGDNAQEELGVGIGALAGSTIMLLTIPWCLSLIGGRVNLDADGNANYAKPRGATADWAKLSPPGKFAGTGVNVGPAIKYTARIMLLTAVPFLVIQVPALFSDCLQKDNEDFCKIPRWTGLVGGALAVAFFVFYLWDQARIANTDPVKEDMIDQIRTAALSKHYVGLRGLFPLQVMDSQGIVPLNAENKRFRHFLSPFFRRFDVDNSGVIDKHELSLLLQTLGEKPTHAELDQMMKEMDTNHSGDIDYEEFVRAMVKLLTKEPEVVVTESRDSHDGRVRMGRQEGINDNNEEDEEDEPSMPEDLANLSPDQQQRKLLIRSFVTMIGGVFVVLIFSDPMVDVLSEVGSRIHINPFYVAFCLAPLASNASELIAAFSYAQKKTEKTITLSIASLLGAACMNNTFCLSIFLFLVYLKELKWTFGAETITILAIEVVMFAVSNLRVQRTYYAILVILLFPLAIAGVVGLEALGWD